MKKIILAQTTVMALMAAGMLFQQGQHDKAVRHYQQAQEHQSTCYKDEIGIWMNKKTTCVPIDDIMDDAEYNSIIERIDRVMNGRSANYYSHPGEPYRRSVLVDVAYPWLR